MSFCHPHSGKAHHGVDGFSLIEMLVVVAIVALLAALTVPSLQGLLSSNNLDGSANSVIAQLDLARQTASTRNLAVDVRLYQDSSRPRDNNGNYPYRIIALVIPSSVSGASSDEFITQPLFLSGDVIIDSNTTYSSALNVSPLTSGLQPVSVSSELSTAPYAVRNLPYVKFTYLPNGTIDLDPSVSWCLTLLNQNKANPSTNTSGPANNFVSLVLDVQTSRARVYQP